MKYLVLKAWADSMENDASAAFGYAPFAVTDSETDAKMFCEGGGVVTKDKFGWASREGAPIYRYEPIKELNETSY